MRCGVSETEIEIALLRQELEQVRSHGQGLQAKLDEMDARDRQRMRAAIVALGGALVALGSYVWHVMVGVMPK
jgi:hypothetical protein